MGHAYVTLFSRKQVLNKALEFVGGVPAVSLVAILHTRFTFYSLWMISVTPSSAWGYGRSWEETRMSFSPPQSLTPSPPPSTSSVSLSPAAITSREGRKAKELSSPTSPLFPSSSLLSPEQFSLVPSSTIALIHAIDSLSFGPNLDLFYFLAELYNPRRNLSYYWFLSLPRMALVPDLGAILKI